MLPESRVSAIGGQISNEVKTMMALDMERRLS